MSTGEKDERSVSRCVFIQVDAGRCTENEFELEVSGR